MTNCLPGSSRSMLVRANQKRLAGRPSSGDGKLAKKITAALPYSLTPSQAQAGSEINADLGKPERMLRLLQGDVGSGKTVVALLAAATVIEAGRQAALMAPTEILARQHHKTIAPLAEAAGLRVAILTGRERGPARADILARLASGELDLLVGTHALFQEEVEFRDLALAIVDEQHRFGVHQRLALARKGEAVDVLVLTATPIPRTLVLTYFGDMDVSQLREKPAGRQPIDTRAVPLVAHQRGGQAVGRALERGERVYWVCPLVAESEVSDLAAAEQRFAELQQHFDEAVDLVHGKMKGADKDAAMARFASGESQLLVATTVIEVGVDVPEATVMVIEHAERFGLAQIHQLRGRVGRGRERSTCLLLYRAPLGETAKARIEILRETEDGFRIAEEDLRLRGEGDVLGTRQSGMPGFRVARIEVHGPLLEPARKDAQLILSRDPDLTSPRGRGAAPPALFVRARRGDPAAAGWINFQRYDKFIPTNGVPAMAATAKRTFSLPDEQAKFIDKQVKSGGYASGSEVVRAGLRALQERDAAIERWLRERGRARLRFDESRSEPGHSDREGVC